MPVYTRHTNNITLRGAANTFLLIDEQDADFQNYVRVQKILEVGDRGVESGGYGYSGGAGYHGLGPGANGGLTVDDDGDLRTDGMLLSNAGNGLVLKSVDNHYYSYVPAAGGVLVIAGVDMGTEEP